ncbi:MAG: hypothetical protein GF334_06685, partial [Candidatus Altiarchaeales archaeon]|nr:hypothetical protein [Candidatus Altiarchaeales archaeon]
MPKSQFFPEKLISENFLGQLNTLYARGYEPQLLLSPLGFEKKDGSWINRLGWGPENIKWIQENPESLSQTKEDALLLRDKSVVFCGMGGSGLSVELVKKTYGLENIYSLRTTDPSKIAEILSEVGGGYSNLVVVAVSKSGTTKETISHLRFFEEFFTQKSLDPKDHIWLMTDPGSPLEKEALDKGYELRYIQLNQRKDVGGRFTSPTTNVFLLPYFIGEDDIDFQKILDLGTDEIFLRLASFLYSHAREGRDKLTLIAPAELGFLPNWAQQLFEESLGKDGKGISVFFGERLDETTIKPADKNDRVFLRINLGDSKPGEKLFPYLNQKGYPVFQLTLKNLHGLGGLLLGLQITVAAIGCLWSINFVGQPAVEGYKRATHQIMQQIKGGDRINIPDNWRTKSIKFQSLTLYPTPLVEAGILGGVDLAAGQAWEVYA